MRSDEVGSDNPQPQRGINQRQPPDRQRPLRHPRQREQERGDGRGLKREARDAAQRSEGEPEEQAQRQRNLEGEDACDHTGPPKASPQRSSSPPKAARPSANAVWCSLRHRLHPGARQTKASESSTNADITATPSARARTASS